MSEQPFTYEERSSRVIRALLSRAEELASGTEDTSAHIDTLRWEATVIDLERQLREARGTIEILKEAIEGYLEYLNDTGEMIARRRQEIDELDMKGAATTRMLRERLERLRATEEG